MYVHLLGMSGVSLTVEQEYDGDNFPEPESSLPEPSLRMNGAANIAQMESFLVSKIDFTYDDEPGIMYVQDFNPYITYAMLNRDIDPVPDDDDDDDKTVVVVDSGGGCDAGFGWGAAAFVFALAVLAAVRRRRA
jgi:hypothetical protein